MVSKSIQKFQAKIVGNIVCKSEIKDYTDRKVQGFKFTLEIAKEIIPNEIALLALFGGDTVHVQIQDAARSITSKFITAIRAFKSATRTSGDEEIRYLAVPLTVNRNQIQKPDNLFDLQLEEYVYVEISPHQLSIDLDKQEGDKADKTKHRLSGKAKKAAPLQERC